MIQRVGATSMCHAPTPSDTHRLLAFPYDQSISVHRRRKHCAISLGLMGQSTMTISSGLPPSPSPSPAAAAAAAAAAVSVNWLLREGCYHVGHHGWLVINCPTGTSGSH